MRREREERMGGGAGWCPHKEHILFVVVVVVGGKVYAW